MNPYNDIRYIKALVDKFYQGQTSDAEEQVLARFFREENAENVPADILADAKVFRSLQSLTPESSAQLPPPALAVKLEEMTRDDSPAGIPRLKRMVIWIASAAAAAACLAWIALAALHGGHMQTDAERLPTVALVETEPEEAHQAPAPLAEDESNPQSEAEPQAANRPATISHPRQEAISPREEPADGFKEIDDPEEAARIMSQIGSLLASNIAESNSALSKINTSLLSYKEITKDILQ